MPTPQSERNLVEDQRNLVLLEFLRDDRALRDARTAALAEENWHPASEPAGLEMPVRLRLGDTELFKRPATTQRIYIGGRPHQT